MAGPGAADAVLADPAVRQAMLAIEAVVGQREGMGDAMPEASRLLQAAGVRGGCECASLAPAPGSRLPAKMQLLFQLRDDGQRQQLFGSRGQLITSGVVFYLDQQMTDLQKRRRGQLRASPSFKAAEEAEAARVRAKQRGARVLWLPSGCVVGDTVWVLEYAQELDAAGSG